jgi:hypothetical protein
MTISFFITDIGEFYASLEETSLEEANYAWLIENRIDLGRESSFKVAKKSPIFDTLAAAEVWLTENRFSKGNRRLILQKLTLKPARQRNISTSVQE